MPAASSTGVVAAGGRCEKVGHLGQMVDVGFRPLTLASLGNVLAGGVVGGSGEQDQVGAHGPLVRRAVRFVETAGPAHLRSMSRTMKALLGAWIAILVAVVGWVAWDAVGGGGWLAIGGPFALTDQNGTTVTSDSLKGKPT